MNQPKRKRKRITRREIDLRKELQGNDLTHRSESGENHFLQRIRQAHRRNNHEKFMEILHGLDMDYIELNDSTQIRINGKIDIWPASGKWHHLGNQMRGKLDFNKDIPSQINFLVRV